MPIGYHRVVCSIGREVVEEDDGRVLCLKVNAVNDCVDASAQGSVTLGVPAGWNVEHGLIKFDLPTLGHQITDIRVTRPDATAVGQIKLRYDHDGQTFQDVLEVGQSFELDIEAENRGDVIVVTLTNPTAEAIDAEVSMVTPIETWPKDVIGPYSILEISPRTRGVTIEGGHRTELTYTVRREEQRALVRHDSYWAVAKLMCNGRIKLVRCDATPEGRVLSEEKWLSERSRG
jgi:hypothetical protein